VCFFDFFQKVKAVENESNEEQKSQELKVFLRCGKLATELGLNSESSIFRKASTSLALDAQLSQKETTDKMLFQSGYIMGAAYSNAIYNKISKYEAIKSMYFSSCKDVTVFEFAKSIVNEEINSHK